MMPEEKRKMERFDLEVFSLVKISPGQDDTDPIEICSKNICSDGAYFETPDPLPLGTSVALSLKLKVNGKNKPANNHVSVEVTGKVIRSEKGGMAIQFDNDYRMIPIGKDLKPVKP